MRELSSGGVSNDDDLLEALVPLMGAAVLEKVLHEGIEAVVGADVVMRRERVGSVPPSVHHREGDVPLHGPLHRHAALLFR